MIEFLELGRGIYIEGNNWCVEHQNTELMSYFHLGSIENGQNNEIESLTTPEDCRFGDWNFGFYVSPDQSMFMAAEQPDRITADDYAELILISNGDYGRGVFYSGAYRTYAQSVCLLAISNEREQERAEFLRSVLAALSEPESVGPDAQLPQNFGFSVHPNPFNPSIQISYELTKGGW